MVRARARRSCTGDDPLFLRGDELLGVFSGVVIQSLASSSSSTPQLDTLSSLLLMRRGLLGEGDGEDEDDIDNLYRLIRSLSST